MLTSLCEIRRVGVVLRFAQDDRVVGLDAGEEGFEFLSLHHRTST